jgi:hypothetical protein
MRAQGFISPLNMSRHALGAARLCAPAGTRRRSAPKKRACGDKFETISVFHVNFVANHTDSDYTVNLVLNYFGKEQAGNSRKDARFRDKTRRN